MKKIEMKKATTGQIAKLCSKVAISAAVVNVFVFYIAILFGSLSESVLTPNGPITVIPVIIASLVGGVIGFILFSIINKASKNPGKTTRIIGYILLGLSLFSTLGLEGANFGTPIFLSLMHLVVGIPLTEGLSNLKGE